VASIELSARDWAVLDRLREMGDSLEQSRHTLFFFYKRKESETADFDRVSAAAEQKRLSVAGRNDDGLIIEGDLHVDPVSIAPLLEWAEDIAAEADALFDGWECAVVASKH